MSRTKQEIDELAVYGFIRRIQNIVIPQDIMQLCSLWYKSNDCWNCEISDDKMIIDTEKNIITDNHKKRQTSLDWIHGFGDTIVSRNKGITKMLWKIKMLTPSTQTFLFGIINAEMRQIHFKNKSFTANGNDCYGIFTGNGMMYKTGDVEIVEFGESDIFKKDGIVSIELDISQGMDTGKLVFDIDTNGISSKSVDIDPNKEYRLIIATNKKGHSFELIN